jgi:hypothetical protein
VRGIRKSVVAAVVLVVAVAVIGAVLGAPGRGEAAAQVVPANSSPPTISGAPTVGQILTGTSGAWTGTEPLQFAYQWQRCDRVGGACANITTATQETYTVATVDVDATLRVQVTATNTDASVSSTSVPTAVVQAATAPSATGCPPVQQAGPLQLDGVSPPARLLIDRQRITPQVVTRNTRTITMRLHVVACNGRAIVGALVYATPTPYQQFTDTEQSTGADGWATLTLRRLRFFPASSQQQLLVVFVRARKPGEGLLGGISTRRLVAFPVDLRR